MLSRYYRKEIRQAKKASKEWFAISPVEFTKEIAIFLSKLKPKKAPNQKPEEASSESAAKPKSKKRKAKQVPKAGSSQATTAPKNARKNAETSGAKNTDLKGTFSDLSDRATKSA